MPTKCKTENEIIENILKNICRKITKYHTMKKKKINIKIKVK